jgi:putative transposase
MTLRFQNKFRIPSTRLIDWDYRRDAAYFITICTANHTCYFGEIENGKMRLSNVGVLADVFWYDIKNHARNIRLGAYVVMPNHIHGIIILSSKIETLNEPSVETLHVETLHATSLLSLALTR